VKKFVALTLSVCLAGAVFMSGCAPARKPVPTPAPTPAPTKKITPAPTTKANTKADMIAREVDEVPGVKKATVVLSGNTAYIGLDLDANVEKGKTNAIKKTAMDKAKAADPAIKTVYCSSDADTVTRLKKIYQGVTSGTPVSNFARELSEIGRRITPKATT